MCTKRYEKRSICVKNSLNYQVEKGLATQKYLYKKLNFILKGSESVATN